MHTAIQVTASQATRMITNAIKAKIVPILAGSPGIGKSQIVHQIAAAYNLKVIDFRLSQCDPTDLAGFPTIVGTKSDYVPMAHFPIEGDPLPTGYSGWILFLDEATSAVPAVQAASYKLALDRMVGSHRIHKNCAIVMAGNLMDDGAIVYEMSTALQSRLLHLELIVSAEEWDKWAVNNGIDYRITSYIKYKPGNVYTFKPDHTDKTYCCPRTLEFLNRLMSIMEIDDQDFLAMAAGTVSQGVAREFIGYCKIHKELLTSAEIVLNPETVRVPDEKSILYALCGSMAHNISLQNCAQYIKFLTRMPIEFQVICLRETAARNKPVMSHPGIQKWYLDTATEMF